MLAKFSATTVDGVLAVHDCVTCNFQRLKLVIKQCALLSTCHSLGFVLLGRKDEKIDETPFWSFQLSASCSMVSTRHHVRLHTSTAAEMRSVGDWIRCRCNCDFS